MKWVSCLTYLVKKLLFMWQVACSKLSSLTKDNLRTSSYAQLFYKNITQQIPLKSRE